jgi:hypothetical protein
LQCDISCYEKIIRISFKYTSAGEAVKGIIETSKIQAKIS